MYAILLLLLGILLRATNALECWQGLHETTTPAGGTINLMALGKCRAGYERCFKLACSMDEKALEGLPNIPPGTKSVTTTIKTCLPATGECELSPREGVSRTGVPFMTLKKHCETSCCESNACNGESNARNGESSARNNGESNARNGESNARNGESNARNGESNARNGESNARNGTLGLRSLGTVAAMMAFLAGKQI
ncbi:hypothetical protein GPALN_013261 [Globodera pallida]|nr:hypothetical protein GPALN_013261 [Globodera pallida]